MCEDEYTYVHVGACFWSSHTCWEQSWERWFIRLVAGHKSSRSVYSANSKETRVTAVSHNSPCRLCVHFSANLTMLCTCSALMNALEFHNERKVDIRDSTQELRKFTCLHVYVHAHNWEKSDCTKNQKSPYFSAKVYSFGDKSCAFLL